jgi:hypothetical protein
LKNTLNWVRNKGKNGALDRMRNNGVFPHDEDAVENFNNLPSFSVSRRTPEQRAKDLENTLNLLRNKGKDDDGNDPTGEFRMLDSMLPKKRGQTPVDRARDIEGVLDWMRNNGVCLSTRRRRLGAI